MIQEKSPKRGSWFLCPVVILLTYRITFTLIFEFEFKDDELRFEYLRKELMPMFDIIVLSLALIAEAGVFVCFFRILELVAKTLQS